MSASEKLSGTTISDLTKPALTLESVAHIETVKAFVVAQAEIVALYHITLRDGQVPIDLAAQLTQEFHNWRIKLWLLGPASPERPGI